MEFLIVVLGTALVVGGGGVGYAAWYNRRAARLAAPAFGVGAGVDIGLLHGSPLLEQRLCSVKWRSAMKVGLVHGRLVLDEGGVHWLPSRLAGRKVPAFTVRWEEVREGHTISNRVPLLFYTSAQLTFVLTDLTRLEFATADPTGLEAALTRLRTQAR